MNDHYPYSFYVPDWRITARLFIKEHDGTVSVYPISWGLFSNLAIRDYSEYLNRNGLRATIVIDPWLDPLTEDERWQCAYNLYLNPIV